MRFPAGLSARLWGRRIRRPFGNKTTPAILHFSPLVKRYPPDALRENANPETEWHTPEACVQAANQAAAPAVWLGGVEPLLHPSIGKVTTALEQSRRYVFLDTSGTDLRKRVHEFQPASRFFFAFQLCTEEIAPGYEARGIAMQRVSEALRIVKLSGFCACAHVIVGAQTSVAETVRLFAALEASRFDGIVVSSAPDSTLPPRNSIHGKKLAEIRERVPSWRWKKFSQLLEASCAGTADAKEPSDVQARGSDACEESA